MLLDMFGYFNAITAARREHPTDDMAAATHSIQHQLRAGFLPDELSVRRPKKWM